MGESLVSKGADVLLPHGAVCPVGSSGPGWHQLSKGYRVNIPEPDTWMLLAFRVVPSSGRGQGGASGARQRICMCVYSATLAIALGRVVFSS